MNRTPLALAIGLIAFTAYAAIVVVIGDRLRGTFWLLEFTYFAVAGIAWAFPALRLIAWAAKGPRA